MLLSLQLYNTQTGFYAFRLNHFFSVPFLYFFYLYFRLLSYAFSVFQHRRRLFYMFLMSIEWIIIKIWCRIVASIANKTLIKIYWVDCCSNINHLMMVKQTNKWHRPQSNGSQPNISNISKFYAFLKYF